MLSQIDPCSFLLAKNPDKSPHVSNPRHPTRMVRLSPPRLMTNCSRIPAADFICIIPGLNFTVRVSGLVTPVTRAMIADQFNEEQNRRHLDLSVIVQGLRIRIEEAHFHCPRLFAFSDLWNTKKILENRKRSIASLKSPSKPGKDRYS